MPRPEEHGLSGLLGEAAILGHRCELSEKDLERRMTEIDRKLEQVTQEAQDARKRGDMVLYQKLHHQEKRLSAAYVRLAEAQGHMQYHAEQ